MIIILLIPVFLSALLLTAHFLRTGSIFLAILAFLFPFALFIKRTWTVRFVQIVLFIGTIEWVYTLMNLLIERHEAGKPWVRLSLVLGIVAVFTISSASVFSFSNLLRKRYGLITASAEKNDIQK